MTRHDKHTARMTGRRRAWDLASELASELGSELDTAMVSAHRRNIERYQWLLESALSVDERRYVERRVAEEQAALQRISRDDALPFSIAAALP